MPVATTQTFTMPGDMLQRGFWLYVWRMTHADGPFFYVGMTGDSGSLNAASPFGRISAHLSQNQNSNALRQNLMRCEHPSPEAMSKLEVHAHGPIFPELTSAERIVEDAKAKHEKRRTVVEQMEKALGQLLEKEGLVLINRLKAPTEVDPELWPVVEDAFRRKIPELKASRP